MIASDYAALTDALKALAKLSAKWRAASAVRPSRPAPTEYRYLGVTDERNECECCGKVNLKRTVVIHVSDEHDERVAYYGTSCAAHALRTKRDKVIKRAERAQRDAVTG